MNPDYVRQLYDDEYAASYEEKFLLSSLTRADSEHEIQLLRQFLTSGTTWLDVACGTGYFLRQFPQVQRAGMDISPAMLRQARQGNPGVLLLGHDFRDPIPAWKDRWDLVSCMWYAYGLVDTVDDLLKVIYNLWYWTTPAGTCFVPLADPRLITGVNLPYQAPSHPSEKGRIMITGIQWSYVEDGGRKVHKHQIAPNLEFMVEQFQVYFQRVELIRYPPTFPGWTGRPALVASGKRPLASPRAD